MSQLKAVIFDIDGVLVDSKEANAVYYARLLEKAGYNVPSREVIDQYFHLPLWDNVAKLTGSHNKAEIQRVWELGRDHSIYPDHLLVFPEEIESILEKLHKHYSTAIVTSRLKGGVDPLFNSREIKHFFDVVVTHDDYTNPKPHPEPLQVAIKKLDVQPREAVYIGDAHVDVEAANAAGVWSIHLAPKKHDDATIGIISFAEIPAAVQKITKMNSKESD